jgi:phage baseplate assembly protein W
MAISFKSVGKTSTQTKNELDIQVKTEVPIGIVTPLQLGTRSEGILKTNMSLADQISDNLRNLILTNWGERLGQYKFGANLRELTTEISSQENFDNEAMARIKDAVDRWMNYITLVDFASVIDTQQRSDIGKIRLTVTYIVANIQPLPRQLSIDLYII